MKKTNGCKPHHTITGTYPNRGTQEERLAAAHHDVAVLLANARAVPWEELDNEKKERG